MRLSVVTPLYKSAPYLKELHSRVVAAARQVASDYQIVLVNDASPDDSRAIARRLADDDPHVLLVDLSRNFGQQKAIMTGLAHATGDRIFVIDSDLEEEPEWIIAFSKAMTEASVDVVYGVQQAKKRGPFYRAARAAFYGVLNSLSDVRFPENVVTARLMSRRYVDSLLTFTERELFLAGIWHVAGYPQLPIRVQKLDTSPTTYSLMRLASLFINAVTAFSTRPLVAVSISGILLSIVAFVYTGSIIARKIFFDIAVEGWASVMAVTLFIGGLSLVFNGIIAIYIAKIFIEVKQRPLTIVQDVYRGPLTSTTRAD